MNLPPSRLTPRLFTLAYVAALPQQPSGFDQTKALIVGHWVRRDRQHFFLVQCGLAWEELGRNAYDDLPTALLMAREAFGVPLASWELFEPPRGTPLFDNDRRWIRRRHRRQREEFLRLRWPVRPSNRFARATGRKA